MLGAEVYIVARNQAHINEAIQIWQNKNYKLHGLSVDLNSSL